MRVKFMKIVIAMDSFKGSLSSIQAGEAIAEGIRRVQPEAELHICPLADGGEGTVDAILAATAGQYQTVQVSDPLGRRIDCWYGIIPDSKTAVIEMSAAAGITLLSAEERNPLCASTYGVGQIILDAIEKGCRDFIIGIGGSATNDGGAGMLQALGFSFLDAAGTEITRGAIGLRDLAEIRTDYVPAVLNDCRFRIACDVSNPLCGEQGCSAVFGPQKGAAPELIQQMDNWLQHYATLTKTVRPSADADYPGAGAAGGLGFAFLSYLNAKLESGISIVIDAISLEQQIQTAHLVITGEGRLDGQSTMGKTPVGVARAAKKYGRPVIALAGSVTVDAGRCHAYGIDAFFPVIKAPCTLDEAMQPETAYQNLRDTAEQVFRLLQIKQESVLQ